MDIVKNPIVIAILAGALTYAYLVWNAEEKIDKKKNKKTKKDINLYIPLIVAVIAWFLAYAYFEYSVNPTSGSNIMAGGDIIFDDQIVTKRKPMPLPKSHNIGHKFIGDIVSDSSSTRSFSLLPTNGAVPIPKELPDVLLRME